MESVPLSRISNIATTHQFVISTMLSVANTAYGLLRLISNVVNIQKHRVFVHGFFPYLDHRVFVLLHTDFHIFH